MTVKEKPNWYETNQAEPTPVYSGDKKLLKDIQRKDENLADTIRRVLKKYRDTYEQLIKDFMNTQGLSRDQAEYYAKKKMEEI